MTTTRMELRIWTYQLGQFWAVVVLLSCTLAVISAMCVHPPTDQDMKGMPNSTKIHWKEDRVRRRVVGSRISYFNTLVKVDTGYSETKAVMVISPGVSGGGHTTLHIFVPQRAMVTSIDLNNVAYNMSDRCGDRNFTYVPHDQVRSDELIPPGMKELQIPLAGFRQDVTLTVVYMELLRKTAGRFKLTLPWMPGVNMGVIGEINALLASRQPITDLDVLDAVTGESVREELGFALVTDTAYRRAVRYNDFVSTVPAKDKIPASSRTFSIVYQVADNYRSLYIASGHLVYFFSQSNDQAFGKCIVFIIDHTHFPMGEEYPREDTEIEKAVTAMLSKLSSKDRFTLVLLNETLLVWPSDRKMIEATPANIEKAVEFAHWRLFDRPADTACLQQAFAHANKVLTEAMTDQITASMVIMITDGSVINAEHQDMRDQMPAQEFLDTVSIFSVALGHDVDITFLQKLAWHSEGEILIISHPGTTTAVQVGNFFESFKSPIIKGFRADISFGMLAAKHGISSTARWIYNGSEFVVAVKCNDTFKGITTRTTAEYGMDHNDFKPVLHQRRSHPIMVNKYGLFETEAEWQDKMAKMTYVYLQIQNLIKQIVLESDMITRTYFINTLTTLSLEHHVLTPLTVITQDENTGKAVYIDDPEVIVNPCFKVDDPSLLHRGHGDASPGHVHSSSAHINVHALTVLVGWIIYCTVY